MKRRIAAIVFVALSAVWIPVAVWVLGDIVYEFYREWGVYSLCVAVPIASLAA